MLGKGLEHFFDKKDYNFFLNDFDLQNICIVWLIYIYI